MLDLKIIFSKISYSIFFLCFAKNTTAQISNSKNNTILNTEKTKQISDTTKKKIFNDNSVVLSYTTFENENEQARDTGIVKMNFKFNNDFLVDLGNFGTVQKSLKFQLDNEPQLQLGISKSAINYFFLPQQAIFYNTTKPFTHIFYSMGAKQEQYIDVLHTQNIHPRWNMAFRYRKINSIGFYQFQKANNDNFLFSNKYDSKNNRYKLRAVFAYNKLQQDENFGIESDTFLTNPFFNTRNTIPVLVNQLEASNSKNSPIKNYQRNAEFLIEQRYYLNKIKTDSTCEIRNESAFFIKNTLYGNSYYYRLKNLNADSSFIANQFFLPFENSNDSFFVSYRQRKMGSTISINKFFKIQKHLFESSFGGGVEYENFETYFKKNKYVHSYIFADVFKNKNKSTWDIKGNAKLYLLGPAIGNFKISTEANKEIFKKINLQVGFDQGLQSPYYNYQVIETNNFSVKNKIKKQSNTHLFGSLFHSIFKTKVSVHQYLINQMAYWNVEKYLQYSTLFSVSQLEVKLPFELKKWHFENTILVQFSPKNSPVHLPILATAHRIYKMQKVFNKKLDIVWGAQLNYNSPYLNDAYLPLFMQFVPLDSNTIINPPQLSAFFNFKIKRFRAFISLNEIQQQFFKNSINFSGYPAHNTNFRLGLNWEFIN